MKRKFEPPTDWDEVCGVFLNIMEASCLVLSIVCTMGYGDLLKGIGCVVVAVYLRLLRKG